jgi:hypothetical protein
MRDIVVDSCVMRLFDAPGDPNFRALFAWLRQTGTLCISNKLLSEYQRQGNPLVAGLLNYLGTQDRIRHFDNARIKQFRLDSQYNYLCNHADIVHARLTFISRRKKLVSFDEKLRRSVEKFRKVDGIKPSATDKPTVVFFG